MSKNLNRYIVVVKDEKKTECWHSAEHIEDAIDAFHDAEDIYDNVYVYDTSSYKRVLYVEKNRHDAINLCPATPYLN